MKNDIILVTVSGLGFIGKYFVRRCLANGHFVRNVDNVGYAADRAVNEEFSKSPNYRFTNADIRDLDFFPECDVIVNFAAESHVDNAISNSRNFCTTNFLGVQNLLELTRRKMVAERPLFVGDPTPTRSMATSPRARTARATCWSPRTRAATKAAADLVIELGTDLRHRLEHPAAHQQLHRSILKSSFPRARGA